MRLDAELRDFILRTWPEQKDRGAVAHVLGALGQSERATAVLTAEVGAPESVDIAPWVLVVTREAIGYGWPMREVIWQR